MSCVGLLTVECDNCSAPVLVLTCLYVPLVLGTPLRCPASHRVSMPLNPAGNEHPASPACLLPVCTPSRDAHSYLRDLHLLHPPNAPTGRSKFWGAVASSVSMTTVLAALNATFRSNVGQVYNYKAGAIHI
jgi:hypothetical protein